MKKLAYIGLAATIAFVIGTTVSVSLTTAKEQAGDNDPKLNKLSPPAVSPYAYDQTPLVPPQVSSLVRLEDPTRGFFCSGVVITNRLVLTAAHCVDGSGGGMFGPSISKEKILIKSEKNKLGDQVIAEAYPYVANFRADYALVQGDFARFNIAQITTSTTLMFSLSKKIFACGFPWGSETSVCYPMKERPGKDLAKGFSLGYIGFLYPGMSGGPVVDRESGLVFAVNSAVDPATDEMILVPLIGLNEMIERAAKNKEE